MKTIKIEADAKLLAEVLKWLEDVLSPIRESEKTCQQICIAVEEIFVNIANYAYGGLGGDVQITVDIRKNNSVVVIVFTDSGIPFDPLAYPEPDVKLSAMDRRVGGLGIYMVRKMMDSVSYEYRNWQNVLQLIKINKF